LCARAHLFIGGGGGRSAPTTTCCYFLNYTLRQWHKMPRAEIEFSATHSSEKKASTARIFSADNFLLCFAFVFSAGCVGMFMPAINFYSLAIFIFTRYLCWNISSGGRPTGLPSNLPPIE
jgi:hypothetical protein